MTDRIRAIVIDDHPVIAMGLAHPDYGIEVVLGVASVEALLAAPPVEADVVVLDLQLGAPDVACGTAAIRRLLDAGHGPIVIYTSVAEEMILAACLAAGALGAATKGAPPSVVREVVGLAARGTTWLDPAVAGAIRRLSTGRHAGALSVQQAAALQYRGQGLTQRAIAQKIGVSDPEIVNKYLRAAVEKLSDPAERPDDGDRAPGAVIDDLARGTGLAGGLVRHRDLAPGRPPRRGRR